MDPAFSLGQVFRFGLFEADIARNALTRNGVRVKIQDQPFRVLVLLLERPGEIITREELRQRLWPEGTYVDFDGSLNVILKKLRAALDDDSENPRFIETVPRRGYRFIAPVSTTGLSAGAVGEDSRAESRGTAAPPVIAENRSAPDRTMRVLYFSAALLILIVAWFAGFLWRRSGRASRVWNSSPAIVSSVPLRKSVAVLGFRNTSGKTDDAWLGAAFSEMLSTELAGGEQLRLVSGEEVSNLRVSAPWPQSDTFNPDTTARIGTALSSDLLVLGSYTTVGPPDRGQLRLDVRLQEARSGQILTEIAEIGGRQDLFQIVSQVSGKLRARLGIPRLEDSEKDSAVASLPSNPEAARFYSVGLTKLREYDNVAARALFEQAVKADAKFPLAHSMLSRADIFLGHDDQAKVEAKRGLELAGGLSRVQRMQIEASYYHAIADRAKAAEIYKALFDLFPDSLEYGLQLAKLQLESYQPDAALETIHELRRLPAPASDDPAVDLREGGILVTKDAEAADRLYRSAAVKALAQGKKLIYAKAEQLVCFMNTKHLQSPPECEQAYEIFLGAGNRDEAGNCLQIMAEINRLTSHEREALPLYERAIAMFREIGDREGLGVALNNYSLVLVDEGQWSRAEQTYRQALQNFQIVNDKANTMAALVNIGDILVMRGRLQEAADLYRRAWEIADASGRARHDSAHVQYASLLLSEGKLREARAEVEPQIASLRSYRADLWEWATALTVLGDIEKTEGNLGAAQQNYQEALAILEKGNSSVANTKLSLAELSILEGHGEEAEPLAREAVAEFEKGATVGNELTAYQTLARALLAQGKVAEADAALARIATLGDLRPFPGVELPVQILKARLAGSTKSTNPKGKADLTAALRDVRHASEKAQQMGLYETYCEARLVAGELEMNLNPTTGRSHLSALAAETRGRGLKLLAMQAERAISSAEGAVTANRATPQRPKPVASNFAH